MYELYQKRQIIGRLEEQKQQMIAALWANSNWDDDKGTRKNAISGIESSYTEAVETVEAALGSGVIEEEEKLADNNPFFAAAERGLEKIEKQMAGRTTSNVDPEFANYLKELDQQ